MAKRTIDDLLTQVRTFLNDSTTPYRYSDAELVAYFNSALYEIKRLRPDMWLGTFGSSLTTYTTATTTSEIPFSEIFFQPVVFFITGMAELRDDEFATDGRVALLLQAFTRQLTMPSTGA